MAAVADQSGQTKAGSARLPSQDTARRSLYDKSSCVEKIKSSKKKARQEDMERQMRYKEDENARLRSENARKPISLLEVLLYAL